MLRRSSPLAVLVLPALGLAASAAALDLPNLSGTWQLNKDASDDPQQIARQLRSSGGGSGGRGGGFGGGGGGGGRGGHSHGGNGSGASPSDGGSGGGARDWFAALGTLQIRDEEPALSITDAAGHQRTVYTDGRKTEEQRSQGGTADVTGSWKDGHVVIVSKFESGTRITETFAMSADGSQLTVTTLIEGGRTDVTVHRVYDAVKAGETKPSPGPTPAPKTAPASPNSDDADQSV